MRSRSILHNKFYNDVIYERMKMTDPTQKLSKHAFVVSFYYLDDANWCIDNPLVTSNPYTKWFEA